MEKQIARDKMNVNYTISGSGPAIVLLHGFLENLSIWENLSAFLTKDFTVVCIDLPGFGKSGVVQEIHSMNLMADAVKLVLDTEHIYQCIMVGHSMGGYATLAFAEKYSEKLKGLVLFHSQAAADDTKAGRNRNRTIEVVRNNHKKFIGNFIPTLFAKENMGKFQDEIKQLTLVSEKTSVEGVCAALAGMRDRKDQLELLRTIDTPVFFIVGKQDDRIPMEKILPQLSCPKNCEALILEGVGHMGFIESQEITSLAIKHFAERRNTEMLEL